MRLVVVSCFPTSQSNYPVLRYQILLFLPHPFHSTAHPTVMTTPYEYKNVAPSPMMIEEDESPPESVRATSKSGHSCCGGCCDMRRAVIIINAINIFRIIFFIAIYLISGQEFLVTSEESGKMHYDADEQTFYNWVVPVTWGLTILACNFLGVDGALSFNKWMVGAPLVFYCFLFFSALISQDILGICLSGSLAYPHFVFIHEMNSGIMTWQNYHNEDQSCCSV
mmetsp:Transcript_15584/g.20303  ORF Transcript_15584/g.20303 Transcript_15584/m.20303 type:complete len:224 (+) Transcript_15584:29-700(+)